MLNLETRSPPTMLDKIQQKIIDRDYFLSSHAEDEMVDDVLERAMLRMLS
jgi:hypothetical protein